MAATTVGFIPLQLIPTNAMTQYNFDKGFPTNGTYVVVKTPTVAQQLQLTKSLKEMQTGREINNNESSKPVILRCKRRVDFTGLGCKLVDSHNPSVSRRNERERKRVKMVNMGFETLRQHVPSGRKNKKMSKVETLRSAVQYIKQLQEMLNSADSGVDGLPKIDMSELESKVSELIQSAAAAAAAGNNMNMEIDSTGVADAFNNNDLMQLHGQQQNHQGISQDHMQIQQHSPTSSQGLSQSPQEHEHFYQSYQNNLFTDQYDKVSSDYSQSSPAESLHSPTSSVISDSSYDSVGDSATPDDDDILSGLSNWF